MRIDFRRASSRTGKYGEAGQGAPGIARVDKVWIIQDTIDMPVELSVVRDHNLGSRFGNSPVVIGGVEGRKLESGQCA